MNLHLKFRHALYFHWKFILRLIIIVIMMKSISLLKNENIFGDNWFGVVVCELMTTWLYTNKHALCKTRSFQGGAEYTNYLLSE